MSHYVKVESEILMIPDVPLSHKLMYSVLNKWYKNKHYHNEYYAPSYKSLAKECGITVGSVKGILKSLETNGWITFDYFTEFDFDKEEFIEKYRIICIHENEVVKRMKELSNG